jgi:hypothetical protein
MHGLYQGDDAPSGIPYIAMINDTYVAGWEELPMPCAPMCSPWNRLLAEPPGSDIYASLEGAFPPGTRWQAWPLRAVLHGWLAYAEVELTRADVADLFGVDAEPTVERLRPLLRNTGLEVAGDPPRVDSSGVTCGRIRIAREKTLSELWDLASLKQAYQQTLMEPLARQQCADLERYRDAPVAYFAHHPGMLATVAWSVMGLLIGDTLGHTAWEVAHTLMTDTAVAATGPALKHTYVL